jgi:ribose/xylose/arabinose/galactoside ABC-type transport system permease subunit
MSSQAGETRLTRPSPVWRTEWLHRQSRTFIVWGLLAVLITIGSAMSGTFRSHSVLIVTLQGATFIAMASAAQFFVVVSGGIDLSVGSVATVSGMAAAVIMNGHNSAIPYALLATVGIGVVVGLANGLMINYLRIAPFVATFGMFYILQGAGYAYSVSPVGTAAPSFYNLYTETWAGVPVILVIVGVFWLLAWYVARQTAFGRHLYAIGGDRDAARLAGVRTVRVSILAYISCSVIAAMAGTLELTQTDVGAPDLGTTLLLATVTAVVIGGVSLFGGEGSLIGVLGGVLVLAFLNQLFDTLQINALYQQLIQGLFIVGVLGIYRGRRR